MPRIARSRVRSAVAALAPLVLVVTSGCSSDPSETASLSPSIVDHVEAQDASSVSEVVAYLERQPEAQLDANLLPTLAQVAAKEIETLRSSLADLGWAYESGNTLPSDGVLRLAAQLGRDRESLAQFGRAINRAAAHEVDLALKAGAATAQTDQTAPFTAQLIAVGEASGALSAALASAGSHSPESDSGGATEIYALLESSGDDQAPATLRPEWLMDVLTVSIYRHAPTKYLPEALTARPAIKTPAQEDLLREWIDSETAWQGREARSAMGVDIQSGWNSGWSRGSSA